MSEIAHRTAGQLRTTLAQARRRLRPQHAHAGDDERWNVVTIEATPEEVMPGGQAPPLLAELGDAVIFDIRAAPGGRGTELQARAARQHSTPSDVTRDRLRQVLRQTKQLIEVGEVLVSVPRPEGKRPATPAGLLVDKAEENSDRKGVL